MLPDDAQHLLKLPSYGALQICLLLLLLLLFIIIIIIIHPKPHTYLAMPLSRGSNLS